MDGLGMLAQTPLSIDIRAPTRTLSEDLIEPLLRIYDTNGKNLLADCSN